MAAPVVSSTVSGRHVAVGLAWVGLPLAAAAYQIAAKDAAADLHFALEPNLFHAVVQSRAVWATLAFDFMCFVLWMVILARTSLAAAFPLTAISYALVVLASVFLFHEPLTIWEGLGSLLILTGVFLISSAPKSSSQ